MTVTELSPEAEAPPVGVLDLAAPVRPALVRATVLAGLGAVTGVVGFVLLAVAAHVLLTDGAAADPTTLTWLLVGAAVGVVARYGLRVWASHVSHLASFELEVLLRERLAAHLGEVPLGEVTRIGSGPLKKVVQDDVRALHTAVADSTPLVGFVALQPLAAIVAIGIVDWRLLVPVLLVLVATAFALKAASKDYATQRARYDEANEAINTAVVEFVQGMPVVRTFDDGSTSFRRFAAKVHEFTEATAAWRDSGRGAYLLGRVLIGPLPTLALILVLGSVLVLTGSLDPASLLVALILGSLPAECVAPFMYLVNYVNQAKAGAARIGAILAVPPMPEPAAPRTPADGSVTFADVTFSYDGERAALDGVDLRVPAGTVCAVVGASGSGKSTLARLVARFHDPDTGRVELGGVDLREIGSTGVLRSVALVLQEPFLIDDTVAENIRLGRPDATRAEVEAAAAAAGAHDFVVTELAEGYDTRVGERGGQLSGGQRQRVTIARALLSDAAVVVLDEATAFADPETEAQIQESVARLCRGRTVLVIAHRLGTIVDADQIVVLEHGRLVERGTHDELRGAGGRYARMWEHHERARTWGLRSGGNR